MLDYVHSNRNRRNGCGTPCASSARAAPADQLALTLPSSATRALALDNRFTDSLAELGSVTLRRAQSRSQRCHCSELLDSQQAGPVGVPTFVVAPLRLDPRDRQIGWDSRARGQHISYVLCNDRFLLLEGVQVPNLASHVFGRAAHRLVRDWPHCHGVHLLVLETCVTPPRTGTGYKPANWKLVGETARRRLGADRAGKPKKV